MVAPPRRIRRSLSRGDVSERDGADQPDLVLGVAILAVPHDVPGFVVPGSSASPQTMKAMG
jgi:hypothetical protein